jgi:enolase
MAATAITGLQAVRTFDGCARPSFEVVVETAAARVRAAPSYSDPRSSGIYEINHFPADGVDGSVRLINTLVRERLVGMDAADQEAVDAALIGLDASASFETIGGNTVEAVSMAVAKAAAASKGEPLFGHVGGGTAALPHLMLNIIGGGATMGGEGWRGRTPDIQDHLVVPVGFETAMDAMAGIAEVFHVTGALLREADPTFAGGRDEEYSWIPHVDDITCLDVLQEACRRVSDGKPYGFRLGLDVGASDLWSEAEQAYVYANEGVRRSRAEQQRYMADLVERYDLFYLEDAFFEDHVEDYVEQTRQFGDRVMIIGDDLLATNIRRLEDCAARGAINAAVVKLNMAATVTATRRFSEMCRRNGFATIAAARTYDSPDDTLADLVVSWASTGYKCGGPTGGEHVAKYNRFLRIWDELGPQARFAAYPGPRP